MTSARRARTALTIWRAARSAFSVTGAEGERYAQIRKTWAGFGKELLTSSDHYTVTFTGLSRRTSAR